MQSDQVCAGIPTTSWVESQKTVNCFILHVLWGAIRELSLRSLFKCRHHRSGPSAYDADAAGLWLPLGAQEVEHSASYRGGPPQEKLEVLTVVMLIVTPINSVAITFAARGYYRVARPSRRHFPHSSSNVGHDLGGFLTVLSWLHRTRV